METIVKCPHCHGEIAIADHQHVVPAGIAIGKDSNLGTIILPKGNAPTHRMTKLEQRIEALKAHGIKGDFFSVKDPQGNDALMTWENGVPKIIKDAELDAIERRILDNGYVRNSKLYRRFVMAQMFRMENWKSYNGRKRGYTEYLRELGYGYSWKMAIEELRVLSILERKDKACFDERKRWFDKDTIVAMLTDYQFQLASIIDKLPVHRCKRVPYKKTPYGDIFVSEITQKVFTPLVQAITKVSEANSINEIYNIVRSIKMYKPCWNYKFKLCPKFVDAYKGEGAFYTLKNLVLFHNCFVCAEEHYLYSYDALTYINQKADEYADEGWKLMGLMRETIRLNHFNFKARMEEIHSNK